jgi:hypothetical protein
MDCEQWRDGPDKTSPAAEEGPTGTVEQTIKEGTDFNRTADLIKEHLVQRSIRDYFQHLLAAHGVALSETVSGADLDKDFGRQILTGERRTRKDNYIKLGIAIGLNFHETQSLLKFMQTGQLYILRQRDAAIMFCIQRKYNLMDTQLMLDTYGYEPLGDGGFHTDEEVPIKNQTQAIDTRQVEQIITHAADFTEVLDKTAGKLIKGNIEQYFDELLERKGIQRKDLFEKAGIVPYTGYQLLRGVRRSKNRDIYLKIAIIAGLNLDETQRMLNQLNVGAVYPLIERDAVIYFGMNNGYSLERIQELLKDRGFLTL